MWWTILEWVWFVVILLLATTTQQFSVAYGFIAGILGVLMHIFVTNKGNPWIVNLYPLSAGFRMLVADMILWLALLNAATGNANWLLIVLTAVYIPFEYFMED